MLIAVCLPGGVSGGVWALWLLNYNLSIAVAVGFIALAGLVVELGVLMLSYLKLSEAAGHESVQAFDTSETLQVGLIVEGAARRLRPICMTAATVIFSLLAIMQSTGSGSETMQRIAAPMVGGMISAMLVTLIVIPLAYAVTRRGRTSARASRYSSSDRDSNDGLVR